MFYGFGLAAIVGIPFGFLIGAWMVIVAVEMLSGSSGIGAFVWVSYNGSNLPAVMAAIIVVGAVGRLVRLLTDDDEADAA